MNNGKIGPIKFFTWSFRGMSVAIQAVLISYITFYCTDVLGLRPRMEGTLGSVNGFAGKIGQAAGTFVCGVLLGVAGYVGGGDTIVSSALTMIKLLYSIIPAALFLLIFVILIKYDLDKNIEQIRSDNEARRQGAATEQE